jgi:hypothetical protein
MVVIGIWVDTGKQEKKRTGMEFLIYLARVVICHLAQEKSEESNGPGRSKLFCYLDFLPIVIFFFPLFLVLNVTLDLGPVKLYKKSS